MDYQCWKCGRPTRLRDKLCPTCEFQEAQLEEIKKQTELMKKQAGYAKSNHATYSDQGESQGCFGSLVALITITVLIGTVWVILSILQWLWMVICTIAEWIWMIVTYPFKLVWAVGESSDVYLMDFLHLSHQPQWWEISISVVLISCVLFYLLGASEISKEEGNKSKANILLTIFIILIVAFVYEGIHYLNKKSEVNNQQNTNNVLTNKTKE